MGSLRKTNGDLNIRHIIKNKFLLDGGGAKNGMFRRQLL